MPTPETTKPDPLTPLAAGIATSKNQLITALQHATRRKQ
jgi:hypothetical protein